MTNKDANKKDKQDKNQSKSETSCAQDLQTTRDLFLRVNADFQNFKKRVEKEKAEWISTSQAFVIEKFLPFTDDLDRAIKSCKELETDTDKITWLQGFEIIQKNLQKNLSDMGVNPIDCSGQFDPEYHEALMQVDSDEYKSGQIVQVLDNGYMFKDKVLRPAKVSVAK